MEIENEEIDFRGYTEKQLEGVLRFTKAIADKNVELSEAAESARNYAKARNKGRSGRATDESDEQTEITASVREWLKRCKGINREADEK